MTEKITIPRDRQGTVGFKREIVEECAQMHEKKNRKNSKHMNVSINRMTKANSMTVISSQWFHQSNTMNEHNQKRNIEDHSQEAGIDAKKKNILRCQRMRIRRTPGTIRHVLKRITKYIR